MTTFMVIGLAGLALLLVSLLVGDLFDGALDALAGDVFSSAVVGAFVAATGFGAAAAQGAVGTALAIPIGLVPAREAFCARWPGQDAALRAFFRLLDAGLVRLGWLAMLAEPGTEALARDGESVSAALARCGVHGLPREVLGALSAILAMRP